VVEALNDICEVHGIKQGKVKACLDGEQAMKEAFGDWPLDPSRPNYNMLQHIRGMISSSPLKLTSRWIKSHQDDNKSLAKIDRWGPLNVECDGLAKCYWNTITLTNVCVLSMQCGFENWSLWIANRMMSQVEKTNFTRSHFRTE
jgi:hypothetical protein